MDETFFKMKSWAWQRPPLTWEAEELANRCTELSVELREHNPSMPVSVHLVASSAIRMASNVYREARAIADERSDYRWMIIKLVESGEWP
jgi:hypothetical protein